MRWPYLNAPSSKNSWISQNLHLSLVSWSSQQLYAHLFLASFRKNTSLWLVFLQLKNPHNSSLPPAKSPPEKEKSPLKWNTLSPSLASPQVKAIPSSQQEQFPLLITNTLFSPRFAPQKYLLTNLKNNSTLPEYSLSHPLLLCSSENTASQITAYSLFPKTSLHMSTSCLLLDSTTWCHSNQTGIDTWLLTAATPGKKSCEKNAWKWGPKMGVYKYAPLR